MKISKRLKLRMMSNGRPGKNELNPGMLFIIVTNKQCWPWVTNSFPSGRKFFMAKEYPNMEHVVLPEGAILMYVGRSNFHFGNDDEPHFVFLWNDILVEDTWQEFSWNLVKLEKKKQKKIEK